MELNSPLILYLGLLLVLFLCLFKFKRKIKNLKSDKKVANTEYIKETSLYKSLFRKYKVLKFLAICICAISLFFSLILIARPIEIKNISKDEHKKDIFLCLDVSGSMYSINADISKTLKNMVAGLKGDRFGIVLFNSSATVAVPLTSDLHYVETVLDTFSSSFDVKSDEYQNKDLYERSYLSSLIDSGTSEREGSSIMPDALATCAFDFPDIDKERTRIIIFSTDNELAGTPLLTMSEAADVCAEKDIKVYAITPRYVGDEIEFTNAMKKTGGQVFKLNDNNTVASIINEIQKMETKKSDSRNVVTIVDRPEVVFVPLLISVVILLFMYRKVSI